MSPSGFTCHCPERHKPIAERKWVIVDFKCNHSAFNGYHETRSDYSGVRCNGCGCYWRAKGKFVDNLAALGKFE